MKELPKNWKQLSKPERASYLLDQGVEARVEIYGLDLLFVPYAGDYPLNHAGKHDTPEAAELAGSRWLTAFLVG